LLHHKRENHNRLKSLNYFRISLLDQALECSNLYDDGQYSPKYGMPSKIPSTQISVHIAG
jgi:hypothetical protein